MKTKKRKVYKRRGIVHVTAGGTCFARGIGGEDGIVSVGALTDLDGRPFVMITAKGFTEI